MFEERDATLREPYVSWRPLDEPAAKSVFKTLQLQADRPLGRPHGLGRARKTVQLGDVKEGLDGVQVEMAFDHFDPSLLILIFKVYQNRKISPICKLGGCLKGIAMPLTHISMRIGKSDSYRQAIFDALHCAMRETFAVPEDNQFIVLTEHDASNFRYGASYLGISRSDDLVFITMVAADTRTLDQKKALFRRITEVLGESPGLRPEDVFVNLIEIPKENWSLGLGLAQYA